MAESAEPEDEGATPRDGRSERGARNREAILDAVYRLVEAEDLMPTAEQVAEKAGVGIRTVFRHFSDMEALYAEVSERVYASVRPLIDTPVLQGGFEERASAFAAGRFNLFERIAPFKRAGLIRRPRSKFLQADHAEMVRRLRASLMAAFPELANAPPTLVESLDQISSFEAWDRLRGDQRLDRAVAQQTVEFALRTLLSPFITNNS